MPLCDLHADAAGVFAEGAAGGDHVVAAFDQRQTMLVGQLDGADTVLFEAGESIFGRKLDVVGRPDGKLHSTFTSRF